MPSKFTVDELATRLKALYRGGEYFAKCPVHSDTKESLTFREDESTGKILFTCHAGCDNADILKALAERGLWGSSNLKPANGVTAYIYKDADGKELYRVLRCPDKQFPVGRFVNESWVNGLGDSGPVLYNLDMLLTAEKDKAVFITEGEKDADTATALGLLATTNANGGDPGKWRDTYTKCLTGRNVVLLEDNDAKGRERVTELKKRISPYAKSVSIISFRDMGKGADLTDWVEVRRKEGRNDDEIRNLLREKMKVSVAQERLALYNSMSIADLILKQGDLDTVAWILPGTLPEGEALALIGDPGCGKSTAAMAIGKEIQIQREAKGLPRGKIMYLLLEGNTRNMVAITHAVGLDPDDVIVLMGDNHSSRFNMTERRERDAVIQQILDYNDVHGVALVIFDSFSAASRDYSINDPKISIVMQDLNAALDVRGITIVYINHLAKGSTGKEDERAVSKSLGSATFLGQVRTAFLVEKDTRLPAARLLKLIKTNSGSAPDPERDYVFLKHDGFVKFIHTSEIDKRLFIQDEVSASSELTMKARAEQLVMELFLQPNCAVILASECYKKGEERGISGEILKRALRKLGVENRKGADGKSYRSWPMRDFFYPQTTTSVPTEEKPTVDQNAQLPCTVTQPAIDVEVAPLQPVEVFELEKDCPEGTPRTFQGIFIKARDVSADSDSLSLYLKCGAYFFDIVIDGEVAKRFKTTQEQHCIRVGESTGKFQLISGNRITLQVEDDKLYQQIMGNPSSDNLKKPVKAIEFWPILRKAA